jgi:hypothetical protein
MINYKIVVVGSGISSFFFLKGLKKKLFKSTCVLEGKDNSFNGFRQNNETNFFTSCNFGGLASTWLGGYSEFKKKDLKLMRDGFMQRIFNEHEKFNKIYNKNYYDYFTSKKFLINDIKDSNEINIFENKTLLSNNKILRVKKFKNLKYLKSSLTSVKKIKDKFIITLGDKESFISCDKLVLASGTIGTAVIISRLFKLKKIYFKNQLYFNGFTFFPFKSFNFQKFNFPIKFYEDKLKFFGGTIDFYGDFVLKHLQKTLPIFNYKLFLITTSFLLKKIVFYNAFVNSKYCDACLQNDKNFFFINSLIKKSTTNKFLKLIKLRLDKMFLNNFNSTFFSKIFKKKIGFDKHYYGIFFNKKNKKLVINDDSEVLGQKNLYICDQSAININTFKFVTYFSVANAYSLGKIISK